MEPGWFGRLAAATGFAICHQFPERSLVFGDRTFFVCARCNGLYLGFALGLLYWLIRRMAGGRLCAPKAGTGVLIVAGLPGIPYYFDIWTSYLGLRATNNAIRFGTGLFFGISVTAFSLFLLGSHRLERKDCNSGYPVPGWPDILLLNVIASMVLALFARMPYLFAALLTMSGILTMYAFAIHALIARFFPCIRGFASAMLALISAPIVLLGLAMLKGAFFT